MTKRLLLFLIMSATYAWSQARPLLRVTITPKANVIVGQPVRIAVEVLVPNYFTGAPEFPQFELENAIVVLPEEDAEHTNTTSGGVSFAGIRRTYIVYPEQPGEFRLPPAEIAVSYSSEPPKATTAQLPLPPAIFSAVIPKEAQGLDYFLPTTQLRLTQEWSTDFKGLREGDAIDRTVTVTTQRMQAMLIPPVALDEPAGMRVYSKDPEVVDQKNDRGELVAGRRTQHATYLLQHAGDYRLPAIDITWWDLSVNKIRRATLPEVSFTVAANPDHANELRPDAPPVVTHTESPWKEIGRWLPPLGAATLALVVLLWLLRRYGARVKLLWQERAARRANSEAAYFNELANACRDNDAAKAYSRLLAWLSRFRPGSSLEAFVASAADPGLSGEVQRLTEFLFSSRKPSRWSGDSLLQVLKNHRAVPASRTRRTGRLPALNPEES